MRRITAVLVTAFALGACDPGLDPRAAEIASVMAAADEALVRARPALVAGKYQLMAADPYAYFRGSLAVYRSDWRRGAFGLSSSPFSLEAPHDAALPGGLVPLGIGDPHPENFGILRARDGSFGLESNDFDSAGRVPYLMVTRPTPSLPNAAP